MKHIIVALGSLICMQAWSQDMTKARTELSVFGVQTGFLGFWAHHEWGITESIAIRTEVGWDASLSLLIEDEPLFLAPVIAIEPRHYYNFRNRSKKGNRTDGNSGNYFGLRVAHHFNSLAITTQRNLEIIPDLNVYGKWGFRRSIGRHFNYEFGVGYGITHYFAKSVGFGNNYSENWLFLDFKFGYRF